MLGNVLMVLQGGTLFEFMHLRFNYHLCLVLATLAFAMDNGKL